MVRLHYIGLWNYADDEGRGVDEPRLLKAELWALDDTVTARKVEGYMAALEVAKRIVRYEVAGQGYYSVVNWKQHQKINKPQVSELPPPPLTEVSGNAPGTGTELSIQEGKGREGGREEEGNGVAALTPQQRMFGAVCEGMGYEFETLTPPDEADVGKVAAALLARGLDPDDCETYIAWLTGNDSPVVGGTRLTIHTLPKWVKDWKAKPRVVQKSTGAASAPGRTLAQAEQLRRAGL